jgi:3-oxoacyl-[acyl-carrier-protein] synthase II
MTRSYDNDENRPVVTGLGVLAANGIGVAEFWRTIVAGHSGVAPITLFDAGSLPHRIAAEVKGFDPQIHLPTRVKWKRMARHTQFALAALEMALADAGLIRGAIKPSERIGVIMGVSTSAMEIIERWFHSVQNGDRTRSPPWLVQATQPNAVTAAVSEHVGVCHAQTTLSTACQAGLDALLAAAETIRAGKDAIVIAGGTDAPISIGTYASFSVARSLLSARNDDPARASRPFDRDRDGGVLGEGAGLMVIESLAHARARGARVWLEICGGASVPDAQGAPTAEGMGASMKLALANARRRPEEIDYICAHGPSDPVIDRVETAMIRRTFGRHAFRIPVSSIKGVTGNPLAAAGPMELITCALAMLHDRIPPTANYATPDPECDLDYVPQARQARIEHALINVHGMGGGNTTMVVRRPPT